MSPSDQPPPWSLSRDPSVTWETLEPLVRDVVRLDELGVRDLRTIDQLVIMLDDGRI